MALTYEARAEIWDSIASIRDRAGDHPGAVRARQQAQWVRDIENLFPRRR